MHLTGNSKDTAGNEVHDPLCFHNVNSLQIDNDSPTLKKHLACIRGIPKILRLADTYLQPPGRCTDRYHLIGRGSYRSTSWLRCRLWLWLVLLIRRSAAVLTLRTSLPSLLLCQKASLLCLINIVLEIILIVIIIVVLVAAES